MITYKDILNFLEENKDKRYKDFSSSLIPGCSKMIGVRLPLLRKLAKAIAKENDIDVYLKNAKNDTFEEVMLQGLVIGYSNLEISIVIKHCKNFVPKINNWSVCDSFCNSLKIAKKYPKEMWNYITSYLDSNKEYELRFMIVMCLSHYINDRYINEIFEIVKHIKSNDYYVEMALAWLLSVCYIKYPEKTLNFLQHDTSLSNFCYNKSLQKILESFRVSNSEKNIIRKLKK